MKIAKQWMVSAVVVGAFSASAFASSYVPNEVIVKYRASFPRERAAMNELYDSVGVESVYRFTGMMNGYEKLRLKPGTTVDEAMRSLRGNANVELAQPNYILSLPTGELAAMSEGKTRPKPSGGMWPTEPSEPPRPPQRPSVQPIPAEVNPPVADPENANLYGLRNIQAEDAWSITRGSKGVIVADIDTGIDYNHEDLSFNLWRDHSSGPLDTVGYDFVHNDELPFDDVSHGTHTAGTIGGVGGNGVGVSGVAQRVTIMALKFLGSDGSGTSADAVRAIDFAVQHGAKISNNSWGGPADEDNPILLDSINRAKDAGMLFVASAGNDGASNDGSSPSYPAAFNTENMIAVAASDANDQLANFSNYGDKSVHLAAPGVKIVSTVPGGRYKALSGTSMAGPHVAGAAALVWSLHPDWDFRQVKKALLETVDRFNAFQGKTVTGGRLNVYKALQYTGK